MSDMEIDYARLIGWEADLCRPYRHDGVTYTRGRIVRQVGPTPESFPLGTYVVELAPGLEGGVSPEFLAEGLYFAELPMREKMPTTALGMEALVNELVRQPRSDLA